MIHFSSHTSTFNSSGTHVIYDNITGLLVNIYQLKVNVKNDCIITFKTYDVDFNIVNDEYELELKAGDTVIDESGYILKNNDRFDITSSSYPITVTYKLEK